MMVLLFSAWPADAAKRVAIVVGNDDYDNVPKLLKARNDARAMTEILSRLGFEVVSAEDLGRRAMSRALVELETKIEPGDTALIYFAGHGFSIGGVNYLLPVDVPAVGPGEAGLVRDASFSVNALAERLEDKGAATQILILDACRDNPFAITGKRSLAGSRGLSRMDPSEGMFVLYSAGAGQAALDRLGDNDENPNSVFTRALLTELGNPELSMVQVAKRTQAAVKEAAAKVGHEQTPAYYDQIVGDLYLAPAGAGQTGAVSALTEGAGSSVLSPSERKIAVLSATPAPIASFTRSNSGWMVNVSLPEPALQFGYRVGEDGEFKDPGLLDALDQRTAQRIPKTYFELPPEQEGTTLYVTWRDRRGEQAEVFPIRFDPNAALVGEQKNTLEQFWTSWISFREWEGLTAYFTHLVTYRCAISEVRYGFEDEAPDKPFALPPCDPADPHSVPHDATLHMKVPPKTGAMSVQLTYADGTKSEVKRFNAPR
jgi:hypothetical protein